MNRKGFTLIELLAVIVILGVLLGIAIPRVSQYINNSRKESFVSLASMYIETIRDDATAEMYPKPINKNDVVIITLDNIKTEKNKEKSPFGGKFIYNKSYVAIVNTSDGTNPEYEYFIALQDSKGYAIPLTQEENLSPKVIVAKAKNKMEVTIQSICGSSEGTETTYESISGLQQLGSNWNATVFSTEKCGQSGE